MYSIDNIAKVVFPFASRTTDRFILLMMLALIAALIGLAGWAHRDVLLDRFLGPSSAVPFSGSIGLCGSGDKITCVVDGDTLWLEGEKLRLERIDTPELSRPDCAAERALALQARDRLVDLLSTQDWHAVRGGQDRYGRTLASLRGAGGWVGDQLVREGLAHRWDGARRGWC